MADDKGVSDTGKREEKVLSFWNEHKVFEKTLTKNSPKGEFVFYDGPPFATGLPHHGHILGSTSKDLFGRYKTMRGYHVRRRWGWDCHGLPIESIVEKKLGLKNKKEILAIGVEKFNEEARNTVLTYIHEWRRYIERIGRFVDFDNSYKTMDSSYIESVWWGLKRAHEKGHLYEGRKVLMYCPHCETPLAKAEIAMDNTYKDVTEEAVTVKFKVVDPEKLNLPQNTYILAWTTTPWTLPGNVALAVGKDITYGLYKYNDEHLIVAKERAETLELAAPVQEIMGATLVGASYKPLYEIGKVAAHTGKKWEVLAADFVTTEDGTGIVHTAVIYGEDDYQLGLKENLPMVPLLNPNGTYNTDAPEFIHGEYIKKAEVKIKEDLERRELLFKKEMFTHSYPHCYRCGTALIYNAVSSWFLEIQTIKDKLLSENEKTNWIPEHLKHGRFKHIIETAPDWTISRNRFWASPLPFWKDEEGNLTVIGSLQELKRYTKTSGNTYLAMRHGEAKTNVEGILRSDSAAEGLTEKGKREVEDALKLIVAKNITKIYASPLRRTKETAEMIAEKLGIGASAIIYDERLKELSFGSFEGKKVSEWVTARDKRAYDERPEGGESYQDAKNRFGEFLYEIEKTLEGETVLIVTHGIGLESLGAVARGLTKEVSREYVFDRSSKTGEVEEIQFVPLPHNREYELDFHLPYIDQVELVKDGKPLTRTPEVVDCWVESGSMPFAEHNYPHTNKAEFEKRTPGDFISEYIAQTRTWFYYMHVLGVMLFGHRAFSNVVTTGTILAADGEKMSKSKGNFTDPMTIVNLYGADTLRYYLMSSTVMQAEDMNFKDEEVKEVHSRFLNILRNTLSFYMLYADEAPAASRTSTHVLDRWILARFDEVVRSTTMHLDRYDTVRATRPLKEFVTDFSTWYLRRSRDRIREGGEDALRALSTMRYVLLEFSKLIAPVMPFVAEELYQELKEENDPQSVHLAVWPTAPRKLFGHKKEEQLISDMEKIRALASEALMLRQKAAIKVRQPLGTLSVSGTYSEELLELVKDEVNVKVIETGAKELSLDTTLTPELIQEGDERELQRAVAEARKSLGLSPKDKVTVTKGEGPYQVELSTGTTSFKIDVHAS